MKKKKRIKKHCPICNKRFYTYLDINRNLRKTYCSSKCSLINVHNKVKGSSRGGLVQFQCKQCKKTFLSWRHRKAKFCSKKCVYLSQRKQIEFKCQYCKKVYSKPISRKKYGTKFCSLPCFREYIKKNRNHNFKGYKKVKCPHCGKEFFYGFGGNLRKKYCSKTCASESYKYRFNMHNSPTWKGGLSFEPYPLGWNKIIKEQIRYRDKYICQICGVPQKETKRKLHIHHIDYDKKNLNSDNLISLCLSCHCKTNHKRKFWEEFFNDRNPT